MQDITRELVLEKLPRRAADTNKGSYGTVAAFAGSVSYRGAPVLAAEGALRCGAGLVFLALFLSAMFLKGRIGRMNGERWERWFRSVSTLGLLVRLGGLLSLAMVLVSILSVPLFQLLGFPAPERLALVLLAAGLTYTLGKLNRDREKLLRKLLKLKPAA